MRAGLWIRLAAVCLALAGCVGGQTGSDAASGGGGACWRGATPIDLGPETRELGAELAGTYRVPVFWLAKDDYGYHDPSELKTTELTLEITRREGVARGYAECDEASWIPIEVEAHSTDGRLNTRRRAAWLREAGAAVPTAGLNNTFIQLGGGNALAARIEDGALIGHVVGPEQNGVFHTTCYEYGWQVPLSERPSEPGFAEIPVPAELIDAIDGYQFDVAWDGGFNSELTARVRSHSETACWREPDSPFLRVQMGGEVELVDALGVRVAATPVMINLQECRDAPAPCLEFLIGGGGDVRTVGADESLPELGFDDGGAWVSRDAFGVVSFDALTGGAARAEEEWFYGSYAISIQIADGEVGTPRLEVTLNQGGEDTILHGTSAR